MMTEAEIYRAVRDAEKMMEERDRFAALEHRVKMLEITIEHAGYGGILAAANIHDMPKKPEEG